ncbi:MAG: YhfC family intramembrane metalloprotease, partial [Clostridiales bacterium]|nr:YhfC family intramembrane metalloprotease [Clostridiales bacterium]
MEYSKVGTSAFVALGLGEVLFFLVPIGIALFWLIKKKEKITTVLVGAAVFFLFVVILEKPIQNVLIFPTQMGLPDHSLSRYINARPFLWAFLVGLFPGVFEETGRFLAFKTVLKNRRNRETSISYGIGHGCFEVILYLGITYATYISYAVMINSGTFQIIVDQVAEQAPDQVDLLKTLANQIASLTFADIGLAFAERVFAVLFHIGASILVLYACREKKKVWLYPLAVILHTAMDFVAGLSMTEVFNPSVFELELIVAVFG